jgi:ABC-type phosphate/phosphonate transport system permease subunit
LEIGFWRNNIKAKAARVYNICKAIAIWILGDRMAAKVALIINIMLNSHFVTPLPYRLLRRFGAVLRHFPIFAE